MSVESLFVTTVVVAAFLGERTKAWYIINIFCPFWCSVLCVLFVCAQSLGEISIFLQCVHTFVDLQVQIECIVCNVKFFAFCLTRCTKQRLGFRLILSFVFTVFAQNYRPVLMFDLFRIFSGSLTFFMDNLYEHGTPPLCLHFITSFGVFFSR